MSTLRQCVLCGSPELRFADCRSALSPHAAVIAAVCQLVGIGSCPLPRAMHPFSQPKQATLSASYILIFTLWIWDELVALIRA